ncbi:MAG TPA: protein-glutamine gamma-glutamyltransferase [Bacillales bacterium]|nr:protein-glutamine gamma-glutamyltransferase [Bacillales bacterium]
MIEISGASVGLGAIDEKWLANPVTREMVNTMRRSRNVYQFPSAEQLSFRLEMGANTVEAAYALSQSGVSFATFYDSRCNERFWNLTPKGGFRLKNGVEPAVALNDIFRNGRMYAFECATAMVIVLYKATLDSIGEVSFNRLFSNIFLWDWEFDEDLGISWEVPADYFPGDVRYFKNPDVNPLHMEWQGENVIDMGNGLYFGHGIGIRPAEAILAGLNERRKPGADDTAFLMDEAGRPAFRHLAQFSSRAEANRPATDAVRNRYVTVTFGDSVQVF